MSTGVAHNVRKAERVAGEGFAGYTKGRMGSRWRFRRLYERPDGQSMRVSQVCEVILHLLAYP
ncbi:MAG: hypothetical protein LBS04_03230 [Tannerellaceae bacterium]|nr:hypothetical protein [Tannerellaceae bacterium]